MVPWNGSRLEPLALLHGMMLACHVFIVVYIQRAVHPIHYILTTYIQYTHYILTTYIQYTHYIHHPPVRASFMVTSGSSTKGSITPGCEEQLKHRSVYICLQACIHMYIHKHVYSTYTDTHLHTPTHTYTHAC